jgi:hypothetical protein
MMMCMLAITPQLVLGNRYVVVTDTMMMCMLAITPQSVLGNRYIVVTDTTGKMWELDFDADTIKTAATGLTYHCMHYHDDDCPENWECWKRALEIFGFVIIELVLGDYIFLPVGFSNETELDTEELILSSLASTHSLLRSKALASKVERSEVDIAATNVELVESSSTNVDSATITTTKINSTQIQYATVWGVVRVGLILFALFRRIKLVQGPGIGI